VICPRAESIHTADQEADISTQMGTLDSGHRELCPRYRAMTLLLQVRVQPAKEWGCSKACAHISRINIQAHLSQFGTDMDMDMDTTNEGPQSKTENGNGNLHVIVFRERRLPRKEV
jgi:hypothetical protein